jgi:acetyltransferase
MRRLSLVPRRGAAGLTLRPIGPHDRAALLAAFDRLSATSRYRRLLSPDPARHRALVAEDPATREIVGVARYVRTAGDVATADVAVAVVDDWHRRGVGRRLMTELIRLARRDGVTRVMGTTLVDNHASRGLLRSLGFEPAAFFGDTMDLVLTLCAGAARPAAA